MRQSSLYDEINDPEVRKKYYDGKLNGLVRGYWYLDLGLDLINKFKYVVAGIIALAVILKVDDSLQWMITIFLIALPILTILGYLWARFGIRVVEYLNLKVATHFGQYGLKLQERQLNLLEDLSESIKELNKKLKK